MQLRIAVLALATSLFYAPELLAQADDCQSATPIQGLGTWVSDASALTDSGFFGDGDCGRFLGMRNDAFYQWTAAVDGDYFVRVDPSAGQPALAVYSGSGCTTACVGGNYAYNQLAPGVILADVLAGDTFLVQVGLHTFGTGMLAMHVELFSDACTSAPDDGFEDNDDCSTPRSMVSGTFSGLVATVLDSDFYSVVVPPNHDLEVLVTQSLGDIDFVVFDSSCAVIDSPWGDFGYSNDTGIAQRIIFEAYVDDVSGTEACANYTLTIDVSANPCLQGMEDFLEDNDTCLTPLALLPGIYTNLWTHRTDSDFYTVTVPRHSSYEIRIEEGFGFAQMSSLDSNCAPLSVGGFLFQTGDNPTSSELVLLLEVYVPGSTHIPDCASYDLSVDVSFNPCLNFVDDSFEENDSCFRALSLVDGAYPGLRVRVDDGDFYRICVGAGATLNLDALFTHAQGNVDITLWRRGVTGCGSTDLAAPLVQANSTDDNESLSWTNDTGADMEVIAMVSIEEPSPETCNSYDLIIEGFNTCGVLSSFCPAPRPNSTGNPTLISGVKGSTPGSGLHLEARHGPPLAFGYFLVGSGFDPAGVVLGDGQLCLSLAPGAQVGRYNAGSGVSNSIGFFDTFGRYVSALGNSSSPFGFDVPSALPFGGTDIMVGQTWHFQLWHRDSQAGTSTSNLSDALHVTF